MGTRGIYHRQYLLCAEQRKNSGHESKAYYWGQFQKLFLGFEKKTQTEIGRPQTKLKKDKKYLSAGVVRKTTKPSNLRIAEKKPIKLNAETQSKERVRQIPEISFPEWTAWRTIFGSAQNCVLRKIPIQPNLWL